MKYSELRNDSSKTPSAGQTTPTTRAVKPTLFVPPTPLRSRHYDGWQGHGYQCDSTPKAKRRAKVNAGRKVARLQRIANKG